MKRTVTLTWRRLALLPIAGVLGALFIGWSGLVSIAASSGHFKVVEWFLHWTFINAVETQSYPIAVPDGVDLADPLLVQRAAGHFASGCAPCHGAPGQQQSPVTQAMMPWPPRLEENVGDWRDRELYWIGLHGVKYSGMPSWTTQTRPDEIWALVAFLRRLPDLSPEEYRALALDTGADRPAQPALALEALGQAADPALADCARCHGMDGRGRGPNGSFPVIAGQPEAYLHATLAAFASGARESGIMTPAAGIHDDATLRRLAAHYASQDPAGAPAPTGPNQVPAGVTVGAEGAARLPRSSLAADAPAAEPEPTGAVATVDPAAAHGAPVSAPGLLDLGRRIATEGLPGRKLAACDTCHGAARTADSANYPRLAGLPEWYIAAQLQLWRDHKRGGTPFSHLMAPIAVNLTTEQIDALALWYASQPPPARF